MTGHNPARVRRRTDKRCTQAEFEAVRPLLKRIPDERQAIVEAVLVRGASQQSLATAHGVSKAAINKSVSHAWRYVLDYRQHNGLSGSVPPGWATETVTAPRAMLRQFKREVAHAFNELINGKKGLD